MFEEIENIVKTQFRLDIDGIHGVNHWKRVEKIGLYLAENSKADLTVIRLFSILHDSQCASEGKDPEHGMRAGEYTRKLYKNNILQITSTQLDQLVYTITHHSDSSVKSDDLTIQICWDSDRLDLWRVWTTPDPKYLNTEKAKTVQVLDYSHNLYLSWDSKKSKWLQ